MPSEKVLNIRENSNSIPRIQVKSPCSTEQSDIYNFT